MTGWTHKDEKGLIVYCENIMWFFKTKKDAEKYIVGEEKAVKVEIKEIEE